MAMDGVTDLVSVSTSYSSSVINQVSQMVAAIEQEAYKVTLSMNPADVVGMKQSITGLDMSMEVLKSEMKSQQSVVNMLQKSVDLKV
jgi:hypothetical protein